MTITNANDKMIELQNIPGYNVDFFDIDNEKQEEKENKTINEADKKYNKEWNHNLTLFSGMNNDMTEWYNGDEEWMYDEDEGDNQHGQRNFSMSMMDWTD